MICHRKFFHRALLSVSSRLKTTRQFGLSTEKQIKVISVGRINLTGELSFVIERFFSLLSLVSSRLVSLNLVKSVR